MYLPPWLVVPTIATVFALTAYAVYPSGAVLAPARLAVARAAVTVGAFAVLVIEVSSAFRVLTTATAEVAWLGALLAAGGAAYVRRRRQPRPDSLSSMIGRVRQSVQRAWSSAGRWARAAAVVLATLVLAELVVALVAKPNNFDSQTYHLPRIEHWVAQRSVAFFPTAIHRQVTLPPGAEYLLTHLRLLTGGDAADNLLQWSAALGCLFLVTRIAAQLGGGRRAQLLSAFLVGTTPIVTLEATSTQTDLVVALWVAAAATIALDGIRSRASAGSTLALGASLGLTALTKTNGLLAVAPMLLWWALAQARLAWSGRTVLPDPVRSAAPVASGHVDRSPQSPPPDAGFADRSRRAVGRLSAVTLVVVAVAGAVAGPFLIRMTAEFGDPLGPPELRYSIPMQRHDPAAVLLNAVRIGSTALDTPFASIRRAEAEGIAALGRAIGVDVQDPAITFPGTTFPVAAWYPDEDRAAFPLQGTLELAACIAFLFLPRRIHQARRAMLRGYAVTLVTAGVIFAATIKWQTWGNRLLIFLVILAAPMAGVWLEWLFRRRTTPAASVRTQPVTLAVAGVLAVCALAGTLAVGYGFPRRLVGAGSIFTTGPAEMRFLRRPQWLSEYQHAAAAVRGTGARRVGLVEGNNDWEYPWWLMLPGTDIVSLRSVLPKHPAGSPDSVDAIVCTGSRSRCARYAPAGWQLVTDGYVTYAIPPPARRVR